MSCWNVSYLTQISNFVYTENQHLTGSYTIDYLIRHGRKDPKAYTWFVDVYLTCSVGRGHAAHLINTPPSDVFTCCDEVMVLWYMDNNWLVWADMKEKNITKGSTIASKYTVSGDKGGGSKCAGWNEQGKRRYNELFAKIEKSRSGQSGKAFDLHYATTRDPTKLSKNKKASKKVSQQPTKLRNTLSMLVSKSTTFSVGGPGSYTTPPTTNTSLQTTTSTATLVPPSTSVAGTPLTGVTAVKAVSGVTQQEAV